MGNINYQMSRIIKSTMFLIGVAGCILNIFAQSVALHTHDAKVWAQQQTIYGRLNGFYVPEGYLNLNGSPISFSVSPADSNFSVDFTVDEGENIIYAEAGGFKSDTVNYTLGYKLIPDTYAYATVSSGSVTLHGTILENPGGSVLSYAWQADENNPGVVSLSGINDTVSTFSLSASSPEGEYYFDFFVFTSEGDTVKAGTFVTNYADSIVPFHIKDDYASWIDSAIIYEISPYNFVINGDFNDITNKIPDLARLGVNTIWLQPVMATHDGGQGYDIINYFSIRNDYGSSQDLHHLIQTAKLYHMKVMFDFVPNHSSKYHPYAQNSITYGEDSHYYNYYQREFDSAPYSQFYNLDPDRFVYYFWSTLVNLNYNNPEVQRWITEAARYWVLNYDIDGYRFDAVWGVNARNPEFMKNLRLALKRIKPGFLMLAEDKATWTSTFDENFDAAYDWYPEEDWVSHWVWQTDYNPNGNPTIFNYPNQNQRSNLLRQAITNHGNGYAPDAKILRFMENNDQFHFITHHGLARTKMAAALEFTLPGIPLVYNGQETGVEGHPYDIEFTFYPGFPIDHFDPDHLFPYYKNLIHWRKNLPALYEGSYKEITVTPNQYVFAFRRYTENQNVITVLNMGSSAAGIIVNLPVGEMNLDSLETYYLTDLLSGDVISGSPSELGTLNITIDEFSAKEYILADSIVQVTGIKDIDRTEEIPHDFELSQNYPNPFNPATTINYSIPAAGQVTLKVYDVLGEEVATLVNSEQTAGIYSIRFDAGSKASGVYVYRIEYGGRSFARKMLLIR